MADEEILQRGNKVFIDAKGRKTSRPLEPGEVKETMRRNARPFGAELADNAAAETVEKLKKLPNRRDAQIEKYAKGGAVRGDGAAQRGKTRGKMC